MFVNIKYWRDEINGYSGREYTYETHMDLKPGDVVVTPTVKSADQRGIVTGINVNAPKFPCREITQMYLEV